MKFFLLRVYLTPLFFLPLYCSWKNVFRGGLNEVKSLAYEYAYLLAHVLCKYDRRAYTKMICKRRSIAALVKSQGHTSDGTDLVECVFFRRGWVYRLAPEALLLRGMQTELKAFGEMPSVSEQWFCARTHRGGVMVKAVDCGIAVSKFVPQSRYYVHRQINLQLQFF